MHAISIEITLIVLRPHLYETGALRRAHVRGHENVLKRLLVHATTFNLGLMDDAHAVRDRHSTRAPGPRGCRSRCAQYLVESRLRPVGVDLNAGPFDTPPHIVGQQMGSVCVKTSLVPRAASGLYALK